MTIDEAKAYFKRHIDLYCVTGICREAEEMAIQALEQEPCEDAISRQAVLDLAYTIKTDDYSDNQLLDIVEIDDIKDLPSVKPQPTGHWIMRHRKVNTINYRTGEDVLTGEIHTVKELIRYECDEPYCSECGKRAGDTSGNYCCFCGARMESEQNE